MTNEQNFLFMNNKERLAADSELRSAIKGVQGIQNLSAQTILICMPQALKRLDKAYNNLNVVEAKVEMEILRQN